MQTLIHPRIGSLLMLSMLLGACATSPTPPAPVEDKTAPIEREPALEADEEKDKDRKKPPKSTAATDSLLAAARQASEADNYANAIAYLERAVRLDPRNAQLWIQLSAAHLADENLPAATQHARKAIALAGADPGLTRDAWLQLADIREAQGNTAEAEAIRRRYTSISG